MIKKVFTYYFFSLITLVSISVLSCRKDDICTGDATPDLQIKFFDYANTDTEKSVDTLYVTALPQQDTLLYGGSKVSELSLPLNVNDDSCHFVFTSDQNEDSIIFNYTREQVFVSKSCGYKTLFHNLNVDLQQDNDNWIKQIDIVKNEVITDTIVHLKIYH